MNDLHGLVLTPDGEIEEKQFPASGHGLLNALHTTINCNTIEAVRLGHSGQHATMYVDEEGKLVQLPMPNEYATIVVGGFNHGVYEMYYGTAVFLGCPDSEGNDTSLSKLASTYLLSLVTEVKRKNVDVRDLRGWEWS